MLTPYQMKMELDYFNKFVMKKRVIEVSEIGEEKELSIHCTRLNYTEKDKYKSPKAQKEVLKDWIEFLTNNKSAFTKLYFHCYVPVDLFNAICCQENLEYLHIFHGPYKDISPIANLKKLCYLSVLSGHNVESIEPILKLKNLIALRLIYFKNIDDYSCLNELKNLEDLEIEGDGNSPRFINIKSLEFLKKMTKLRRLSLGTAKIETKDLSPIMSLKNLEALNFELQVSYEKEYQMFKELPKLKHGTIQGYFKKSGTELKE